MSISFVLFTSLHLQVYYNLIVSQEKITFFSYFFRDKQYFFHHYLYKFDEKRCEKWNEKHPDDKKKPLRKITPHGLRHTLATLLYDGHNGITPKDVQYVLGHKTSKTAMEIYTHVTEKQKKDIKGSINNLNF